MNRTVAMAICVVSFGVAGGTVPIFAADLVISGNEGKYQRPNFPQPARPDTISVIDLSTSPPVVKGVVEGVNHTIQGPPQAVAITPDSKRAIVGAPTRYDYDAKKIIYDQYLQLIDIEASPPKVLGRAEIGGHSNGITINPAGTLLLAACLDGTVRVVSIKGDNLSLVNSIKVSEKRLAGISFTHDGTAAIVTLRDEGGAATLAVEGESVRLTDERITTGLGPYSVSISSEGGLAAIGNPGLLAMAGFSAKTFADADTVSLVDVSKRPFRTIQHINVPATPEAAALSPDGKWLVVNSVAGSSLTPDMAGYAPVGKVALYSIMGQEVRKVGELPGGRSSQGVIVGKDNKTVLVQLNYENVIVVYEIRNGQFVDTGTRIPMAGPVSFGTTPR